MDNTDKNIDNLINYIKNRLEPFCTDWSIKTIVKNENQIRFSESQIDINKNWSEIKFELFLSQKRRTIDISLNDLRYPTIDKTLEYCRKLLKMGKLNINYKRMAEGPFEYDKSIQSKIFDEKVVNLDENAVDLVNDGIQAAIKEGAHRVAGSFFYGVSRIIQRNSLGLKGEYNRTNLNFRIRAFAKDMYATGESLSCSTHLNHEFDVIATGKEAGEICKKAIGGKKGKPGIYNIIIFPKVSTELQAPTPSLAMNAYTQKMGLAWLIGKKEGDKIAHENISVWDDGTKYYGLASSPFDDELVPTQNTLLIDKGIIRTFFNNTSLSKKDHQSTANAGITVPKPTNTVFSSGDYTLEELMEISANPTLLITSTWYTRYQSYAPPAALSSLPKDGMFLIKNRGKNLEPVRELRINSDHYHMLKNTIALGKKLKQVSTWLSTSNNPVFAPFMLIEDIKMTTGTK
ncbi:MAG: TldD/PmbA family protein [Promethearchaeota archaeon]|nr:MAG: TldD/PmbA family protein [Candidatus Lokiarchaeota archaeon]